MISAAHILLEAERMTGEMKGVGQAVCGGAGVMGAPVDVPSVPFCYPGVPWLSLCLVYHRGPGQGEDILVRVKAKKEQTGNEPVNESVHNQCLGPLFSQIFGAWVTGGADGEQS